MNFKRIATKLAQERLAFEFNTEEELKDYLHQHPKADKSLHWVKKPSVERVQVPEEKSHLVKENDSPSLAYGINKMVENRRKYHKDADKLKQSLLSDLKEASKSDKHYPFIPETNQQEREWREYMENKNRFFLEGNLDETDYSKLFSEGDPSAFVYEYIGNPLTGWNPIGAKVRTSEQAAMLFLPLRNPLFESFKVLHLDENHKVIGFEIHSLGNVNSTSVDVTSIVNRAMIAKAKGVILSHNHPSSNMNPSKEDIARTEEIEETLAKFNIKLLDHVITNGQVYSIKSHSAVPVPLQKAETAWGRPENLGIQILGTDKAIKILSHLQTYKNCIFALLLNNNKRLISMVKISGTVDEQKEQILKLQETMSKMGANSAIFATKRSGDENNIGFNGLSRLVAVNNINYLDIFDIDTLESSYFPHPEKALPSPNPGALEPAIPYTRNRIVKTKFENGLSSDLLPQTTSFIWRYKKQLSTKLNRLPEEDRNSFVEEHIGAIRKAIITQLKQEIYPSQSNYYKEIKAMTEIPLNVFHALFTSIVKV